MPYLPPQAISNTVFAPAQGLDINNAIAIIEERWRRFFPLVAYYSIKKPYVETDATSGVVHATGTTAFDPLYGTPVDVSIAPTGWEQPHDPSNGVNAVDTAVYANPVNIPARITRGDPDSDLHNYGFDRVRTMGRGHEAVIPTSFFDRVGFMAAAGDKFVWDGDEYIVKQATTCGYWANTNVRLYVKLEAEHRRRSSS